MQRQQASLWKPEQPLLRDTSQRNPPPRIPACDSFVAVLAGVAVTFPGNIDNSDETRRPREDAGKVETVDTVDQLGLRRRLRNANLV